MNISTELKKQEAISRLETLKIFPQTIKDFENGLVSISEPPFGAFYWVDEEEKTEIKKFEEEYDALVYMIIKSYTSFGTVNSYLYVSDYEEEWEDDRQDLAEGIPLVYVRNIDAPDCSEFGSIQIRRTVAAGLERIS